MTAKAPVLFAYDFPHRKSQDMLLRLVAEGRRPTAVIAAPWKALQLAQARVRTNVRSSVAVHPRVLAKAIGIPYHVVAHDDAEAIRSLLSDIQAAMAVIGGARIIDRPTIDLFDLGILNLHPGPIPQARGLGALLRTILADHPPTVTAHLIDQRVDAGAVLLHERVPIRADDTIMDVSERLHASQLDLVTAAIDMALKDGGAPLGPDLPRPQPLTPDQQDAALHAFPEWRSRWIQDPRGECP